LFVKQKREDEISLLRFPCHTQAVKKAIKAVKETSGILYNNADKEGFIKSQIESKKVLPKFDSKKDFVTIYTYFYYNICIFILIRFFINKQVYLMKIDLI
jgi:hypothetical protein